VVEESSPFPVLTMSSPSRNYLSFTTSWYPDEQMSASHEITRKKVGMI